MYGGYGRAVVAAVLVGGLCAVPGQAFAAPAPTQASCPQTVDPAALVSQDQLRSWNARVAKGLRSTGSDAHTRVIDWLDSQFRAVPGMQLRTLTHTVDRWQPTPRTAHGRDLERAGRLTLDGETKIPVIGAIAYSRPTGQDGAQGQLVYIPRDKEITAENARGKVVVRDVPPSSQPYAAFKLLSHYLTPDLLPDLSRNYERPALGTDLALTGDLKAAEKAGAAGMVSAFDVPRAQLRGYFDPHHGIHFGLPAVFVGVDEAAKLKQAAERGGTARVAVLAERDKATTRTLIATLPGKGPERIVYETHTDGVSWAQENGTVALLALARYFAGLPVECRPRTLEFALGSGHLHLSQNGIEPYAQELDRDYDKGTVAFVFGLEHLGTREYEAVPRTDGGPGRKVELTGKGEPMAWSIIDSQPVKDAVIGVTKARNLDRTAILKGSAPPSATVPPFCSIGGDATAFHRKLVPTLQLISGPWSLMTPAFGAQAVDIARLRQQLLASGDVVLALGGVPREQIAGQFPTWRKQRADGAATCPAE